MKYFITGGAGFIGSNMVDRLLSQPDNEVTVFDNFCSGKRSYIECHLRDKRFRLIEGDLLDLPKVKEAVKGNDFVFHFAANPDIAKSMVQTDLDLKLGMIATYNVVEAMRTSGIAKIAYSSGSGVYGDVGLTACPENFGPLMPISMYGASKLGAEGIISAFCHMFDMRAWIFRFANVVGKRQTHGVGLDFIKKLRSNPAKLEILGDGSQSKSYIHINDAIEAILLAVGESSDGVNVFNVATDDYISVTEIARIVAEQMGLKNVELVYSGGKRGWKGDVPVVRFDISKIHKLGWTSKHNSKSAVTLSIQEMLEA